MGEGYRSVEAQASESGAISPRLPLRDWILLPLLSALTMLALAFAFKMIGARMLASTDPIGDCIVLDRAKTQRGVPNRACWKKETESPPVLYSFNACGYRTKLDCAAKSPGTYRIALLGSSYPFGWAVKQQDSFAELLPAELSQRTGRSIQVYNASMIGEGGIPRTVASRFHEFLAVQPDAILWIVDPWDIDKADRHPVPWMWMELGDAIKYHLKQAFLRKAPLSAISPISASIQDKWVVSKPGRLIQHYLFQSQSEYVKLYLERGGQSGFLKAEPDADWKYRLDMFNGYAADIEAQAKAAGVPVIVVFVPNRAEAAMISMNKWPAGYDPYKLGEEVRAIVTSHGATYVDILPDFRAIANPEQYYYPIDNHPDAAGHAIIADMLARELTSGAVSPLRVDHQSRSTSMKGNE